MARRVNTTFLLIVALVFVLLIGGGAGFYYLFIHQNAAQLIAKGDKAFADGDYTEALKAYSRAKGKQPNNVEVYLKFAETLGHIKVDSTRVARQFLGEIIANWQDALRVDPDNEMVMDRLMDVYYQISRRYPQAGFIQQMYLDTKAVLDDRPDLVLARKYFGIAQVNRMRGFPLPEDEAQAAREHLEAALAVNSNDWDAIYHLALLHVFQARDLERAPASDPARVRELRDEALRIVSDALAEKPGDPQRQFGFIEIAYVELDQPDRAATLLERLEQQLLEDPASVELVLDTAELLRGIDEEYVEREGLHATPGGLVRAEALLRRALEVHPDDGQLNYDLASTLRKQGRLDAAKEYYRKVIGIKINTDPLTAYRVAQAELYATVYYANLLVDEALGTTTDAQTQQALIDEVEKQLASLTDSVAQSNVQVVMLKGKLDYVSGNWAAALDKLDRVNSALVQKDPSLLLLAARACRELQQYSAAIQRFAELIEMRPEFDIARIELAQLLTRQREFDRALSYINPVLERQPDNDAANWIKALTLKEAQRPREALEVIRRVDVNRLPQVRVNVAELIEIVAGKDRAVEYLTAAFNHDPTFRPVLAMLLTRVGEDEQTVQRLLSQARAAGMSATDLGMIEAGMLGTPEDIEQARLAMVNERAASPLQRHLARMRIYLDRGETDAARRELAEAAKIAPDTLEVLESQLTFALAEENWALANQLAEKGARLNLDDADGRLFFARIEIAMGQYDRAIASLKTAVEKRPIFDRGWIMLGDAQLLAGNLHQAVDAYTKAIELRRNNATVHRRLAETYLKLGEPARALASLNEARNFAPDDRMVQAVYLDYESVYGDRNKAVAERERLARDNPSDLTNRRALARLYADMGRKSDAIATIDKVIEADGQSLENAATKALIHRSVGEPMVGRDVLLAYVNAEEQAGRATSDHWLTCARYLMDINQRDQALSAFQRAISLEDPQTRRATLVFAMTLYRAGAMAEAARQFERVWQTGTAPLRVGLQYAESLIASEQIDKARRFITELHGSPVAAENPAMVRVLDARLALATGDTSAALDYISQAIKLDPRNPQYYVHRGTLLVAMPDRLADAMADAKTAIELSPSFPGGRYLLAALHRRRGEDEQAIRQLREIVTRDPNEMTARKQLAELYQKTGETRLLRELVDESMRLAPNDPSWAGYLAVLARQESDPQRALAQMQTVWETTRTPAVLVDLVTMQIGAGRAQQAVALLAEQSEMVEQTPLLEALQGRAVFTLGEREEGMKQMARAAARVTTHQQLQDVRRVMVDTIGKPTAQQLLAKTAEARGAQGDGIRVLLAEMAAGESDWTGALTQLEPVRADALAEDQRKSYYYTKGLSHQSLTQLEPAASAYKALLAIDADNVNALNNYAYLLSEQLGRHEQALSSAERAAALASNNAYVLDTLGRIQFHVGQLTNAQRTLEKSVKLQPLPTNTYHLGEVALKQGRRFEAGTLFQQALNLAERANDNETRQLAQRALQELKAGEEG